MNDSARENPMPAPTAPAAIECPQCGTQLQLLGAATIHTPIGCCICRATFYIQPVKTAPVAGTAIRPRPKVGAGPLMNAALRGAGSPILRMPDRTPHNPGDPPPAMTTPAPPAPVPGTRSAPGMPKPVQLPEHLQRGFRTAWLESVLGAILVLVFVVAVCAGGFVLVRWWDQSRTTSSGQASDEPATPGAEEPPPTSHQPLPRPPVLFGAWESRIDDGSSSTFVFRSDGTLALAQAGDPPPPPVEYTWYLAERRGDDLVIEVGPSYGSIGNARLTLRMSGTDAFTLTRHIQRSLEMPGTDLRYVRVGAATPPPAVQKAATPAQVPLVGPPAPPS